MVLETFAAIALAGSILQFVEYAGKFVSKSADIYHSASGSCKDAVKLRVATEELRKLSHAVSTRYSNATSGTDQAIERSQTDKAIIKLALECRSEAHQLLYVLDGLQVQTKNKPKRKWESVYQALRSEWKKEQIEDFLKSLGRLQTQLILHLATLLGDQQSSVLREISSLAETSASMGMNTSEQLQELKTAVTELNEFAQSNRSTKVLAAMEDVVGIGDQIATEQNVLGSLQFESMRMRHTNIAEAHSKTFDWIFDASREDPHKSRPKIHFLEWLRSRNGIFWISGKPGSGKSTLMKYLCKHAETDKALHHWADGNLLITGKHFFWNAGTDMQKSLQGLLQSLLYDVLRQHPSWISDVAPSRWKNTKLRFENIGNTRSVHHTDPWVHVELLDAFDRLMELLREDTHSARFCFFVDGLDEYNGDHAEMIKVLTKFAASPNVKICLSSRPWNVFDDAFGQDTSSKLKLEDLTREDISQYVQSKLEENQRFKILKRTDARCEALVEEIVNKASGVFLWVVLVVRSLKEGITNADTISILQMRLRILPADLERFFGHILSQVDKVYWEGTTQAFQIALAAVGPLPLWNYSILDDDAAEFTPTPEGQAFPRTNIETMLDILQRRLDARCKGLLEVRKSEPVDPRMDYFFVRRKVHFLHRTVRDFLLLGDIQSLLNSRLHKSFDPNIALCRALLNQVRGIPSHQVKALEGVLDDFTYYASQVEKKTRKSQHFVLDQFPRHFLKKDVMDVNDSCVALLHPFVVQKGLYIYMQQKFVQDPNLLRNSRGSRLLDAALTPSLSQSKHDVEIHPEMVLLLLENGAQPNQSVGDLSVLAGRTSWTSFLTHVHSVRESLSEEDEQVMFQVFKLLLSKGADPRAKLYDRGVTALTVRDVIMATFCPSSADLLLDLMERDHGIPNMDRVALKAITRSQNDQDDGSHSESEPALNVGEKPAGELGTPVYSSELNLRQKGTPILRKALFLLLVGILLQVLVQYTWLRRNV